MSKLHTELADVLVNGKLPSYAWPGGYPMYYLDGENSVLCPVCAEKSNDDAIPQFRPVAYGVNWEDANMFCDSCCKRIESAYAEDEVQ